MDGKEGMRGGRDMKREEKFGDNVKFWLDSPVKAVVLVATADEAVGAVIAPLRSEATGT